MTYFEELVELDAQSRRVRARTEEGLEIDRRIKALVFAEESPEFSEAQCGLIWDQAWERGHSHGYTAVASEYQDLADWVRKFQTL